MLVAVRRVGRVSMTSRVECLMPKIILSREATGSFATSAASEYMKMSQQLEKIVESKGSVGNWRKHKSKS